MALTIAGSDSGGGAGIAADLRTFSALGVFGTLAVTAVTAQNTSEVRAIHAIPADVVGAQIRAVVDDLHPAAAKTGMLATAETVALVGHLAASGEIPRPVVDPVLISSSGRVLVDARALDRYREALLPVACLVTPNLHEASLLARMPVRSIDDMVRAAARILEAGADAVLVTGGHLAGDMCTDVLVDATRIETIPAPRVATANVHGSGCTLSAAITALLAGGTDLPDAVGRAKSFVTEAIAAAVSWKLGSGHGPLDRFGWAPPRDGGAAAPARPRLARARERR